MSHIAPVALVLSDWLMAAGVLFCAWIAWLLVDPIQRFMKAYPATNAPIGLALALLALHESIQKVRIAQIRSFDVKSIDDAKQQLWALDDEVEPVLAKIDDAICSAEDYLGPEFRERVGPVRALCERAPSQIEANLRRRIESMTLTVRETAAGREPRETAHDTFDDELRTAVAVFSEWTDAQINLPRDPGPSP